jgi:transposase
MKMFNKPTPIMGQPTKLTPMVHEAIVTAVRLGNYIETAAALAGINKTTIYDWMKRGANEKRGIYYDFTTAITKALAKSEVQDLQTIAEASKVHWQAAAWRLERRFPARWRHNQHLRAEIESAHTERTEAVFEHQITSDPETRELLRQLYARQQAILPNSTTYEDATFPML